ncbi:SAM-dependent methyltransferase [Pseudofrankia inefficax]|uniref:S-adenosyl methyltransferase n=1 Tax=Pseudofrankia inefficax (strain DSM 45817 / CECT 9037 / DDB 130130 / EuI1c) TaxID=298654 RepID=E3IWB8_PSEI1|nr:SAM-dependent methyltransferase [Pseudofrankia inefficax]ADP78960.1 protein of unknown function DUF574 [Pseudofrankia inefficax]
MPSVDPDDRLPWQASEFMFGLGGLDVGRAQSARIFNYLLGGKDNFPVDREVGDSALSVFPSLGVLAWESQAFMRRAVAYLARAGFRQFLEIGVGLPVRRNLHDVAQRINPAATVVYVDHDPMVVLHARALLTCRPPGWTGVAQGDLRDPSGILAQPALACFAPDEPVVLSLIGVLPFLADAHDPYGVVATLLAGLPAGSAVMLTHLTGDQAPEPVGQLVGVYEAAGIPVQARSRAEVAGFLGGLELLGPGLVSCQRWHPAPADLAELTDLVASPTDGEVSCYGVVARA